MKILLSLIVLLVATPTLSSQQTWVVDGTGGGNFTTIQAALNAAAAGDTIFVESGDYAGATTSRGVALLGRSKPKVRGLTLRDMPAGQHLTMKGFTVTAPILLQRNRGRVHFESLDLFNSLFAAPIRGLTIDSCVQVSISRGTYGIAAPPISVNKSTVYLTEVDTWAVSASFAPYPTSSYPGIDITDSRVIIAGGTYRGGGGVYDFQRGSRAPSPGITMNGGDLTVVGDSSTVVAAGATTFYSPISAPAIAAIAGTLLIAPTVVLKPTLDQPVRGVTPKFQAMPTLDGQGAPPGNSITVDAFGTAGSTSMLWVSLPGNRLPFVFGDIWLELRIAFPVLTGRIPASAHLVSRIPVGRVFRPGTTLAFQALNVDGQSVQLSTPLTLILH